MVEETSLSSFSIKKKCNSFPSCTREKKNFSLKQVTFLMQTVFQQCPILLHLTLLLFFLLLCHKLCHNKNLPHINSI